MRKLLTLVGLGFVVVACQASLGTNGASMKSTPPNASVDVKADAHGSVKTAAPPGLSEADAEAVCTTMRTADCERYARCMPNALAEKFGGDMAKCVALSTSQCKAIFVMPGVKITPAQAKSCADRMRTQACNATAEPSECHFPGVIADGGTCMTGEQCQSDTCTGGGVDRCGTCVAKKVPKAGAPVGAVCKADGDCDTWATCEKGKCAAAGLARGAKCNQSHSCLGTMNLGCYFDNCIEVTPVVEVGASCKVDSKANTMPYCRNGWCDQHGDKCVAVRQAGEPCTSDTRCASTLSCDKTTKKCAPLKFETAACFK